jgi:chromosome partitioning protein
MKTLTVANQKGGVGKTAVAVHLAFYFAEAKKRVLFIDLDPQGNASKTLKAHHCGLTASALFTGKDVPVPSPNADGFAVVAADDALHNLERADPNVAVKSFLAFLGAAGSSFDVAILDTSPTLSIRMTAALIGSDYALAPVEMEAYSIDGITKLLQSIKGVTDKYNQKLQFLGMLPNRLNAHSPTQKANLAALIKDYSRFLLPAKVSLRTSIGEALGEGVPVWKMKKSSAKEAGIEMREAMSKVAQRMGLEAR